MDALDGNAIAGALFDYFGAEMTTAIGSCGHCGAVAQIAELRVYSRAPGTVVRCRSCGNVVIVVLDVAGELQVEMSGFRLASDA
jgi:ribosomal protein S27E